TAQIGREENAAVQTIAIGELKVELAPLLWCDGDDSDLFPRFANRRFQRRLASFDLAARCIDFAVAKSALLSDEEEPVVFEDKTEIGAFARRPGSPVHG